MTTPLETAFPINANFVTSTLRSNLAQQSVFCSPTADLSGEDFTIQPYAAVAVYGADGDLTFYAYDATDTTTADDGGVSCIVVSGRRYIRATNYALKGSAISGTTTAQPGSPSFGDTYIVPAAPTGDDWASEAKTVATYTARGWVFVQPETGWLVYVEDEDGYYHYDSNGDWIAGLPVGAIQDGSIPPRKLAEPFAILKVEDERNDPPGSPPTAGTMYQVGTSPTGDFSGHSAEVARYNGSGWEFLAPEGDGDMIFRRDLNKLFFFISGSWAAGSGVDDQIFDTSGTWNKPIAAGDDALVFVQLVGGGGGGGNGGGGGGGGGGCYAEGYFRLGDLTNSVTVVVGTGGAASTAGGETLFGAYLSAFGGGGGATSSGGGGGGGGGLSGAGGNGAGSTGGAGGPPSGFGIASSGNNYGAPGGSSTSAGGAARWGGGGGGGGGSSSAAGGASMYGGGGGGGGSGNGGSAGGVSMFSGNGGAGSTLNGSPGQAPGGGGGAGAGAGTGGAGANGRCRVRVIG